MIVPVLCYEVKREISERPRFVDGELKLIPWVLMQDPWELLDYGPLKPWHGPGGKAVEAIPIIGHLHNDPGQEAPHYHIDYRYAEEWMLKKFGPRIPVPPEISDEVWVSESDMEPTRLDGYIGTTHPDLVQKSEISCNHLIKGHICPHRGFDLSTVEPVDGVLTCPLHGLQFCAKTKKLLNKTLDDGINLHGS